MKWRHHEGWRHSQMSMVPRVRDTNADCSAASLLVS
jgi:hypothetical protein